MQWSFVLSRMWRNRREMVMLLVALSLVTGFFALSPLYLRVLGESALRYAVENAPPRDLMLSLISPSPFEDASRSIIERELGTIAAGTERRTVMNGVICNQDPRSCLGDSLGRAYIPATYERLTERFVLVEGSYPSGGSDAAVTLEIARATGLSPGDMITFFPGTADETIVDIVGILQPALPDDPFWLTQQSILRGQLLDITENFQRFDFGVIVSETTYADLVVPIARTGNAYEWFVSIDTSELRAASLNALTDSLVNIEREFRLTYPDLTVASGLVTLIRQFQADLSTSEGTVILFAGGILLLLFYQLMTTTALILERHAVEWSSIISRGGSALQLTLMQAWTIGILSLLAFVIGLPVALLIVIMIGRFSPVSSVLDGGLTVTTIPPLSIALSAAAALTAIAALTIPAIPAARAGLLRLKQSVSRPPVRPVWSSFYVDVILLGLTAVLALRLYSLFGGVSLEALLADPSSFLRVISSRAAQDSGLLSDPFNLALPILLITGIALLWLRLFPLLMRGLGALFGSANGLLAPLALWNIARDPGHYAQLVMMLIGTLAIGTASLALAATHDRGAWNTAREATGGELALTFAAEAPMLDDIPADTAYFVRYVITDPATQQQTTLFGVPAQAFAELAGEMPPELTRPGIALPADAASVQVQVYAEPHESAVVSTRLALDVVNRLGVPRTIAFVTEDDTVTGEFVTYSAPLPDDPYLPYTITGVRMLSRSTNTPFEHVIYLDDLVTITHDGQTSLLDDFERAALNEWALQSLNPVPITPTRSASTSGIYAMRVQYVIAQRGGLLVEPVVSARATVTDASMPVILSDGLARSLMSRTQRRAFTVGETASFSLTLPEGNRELRFRVFGQQATYPTASDRFLIAPADDLLYFLNATASPNSFYAVNTAWLTLPQRQISADLRAQIDALPGLTEVTEAWTAYNLLLREPLPNAIIGVLFAGFWISLLLGLLDFGFYLAMTSSRRATTFAVLRALGLNGRRIWGLLTAEQAALIVPAIGVGVVLGILLAYLLIPFLILFGSAGLLVPAGEIGVLLIVFILSFAALLTGAAWALNRSTIGQVLRLGDE